MKLFFCFTPSHLPLLEQHFLPSVPDELRPHLVLCEMPQNCPTSEFDGQGFQTTCIRKVEVILDALAKGTELGIGGKRASAVRSS